MQISRNNLERLLDLEDSKAYIAFTRGAATLPEPGPLVLTKAADRLIDRAIDWMYLVALRGDFDSEDARQSIAAALHHQMHGYHLWPVTLPWPGDIDETPAPGEWA